MNARKGQKASPSRDTGNNSKGLWILSVRELLLFLFEETPGKRCHSKHRDASLRLQCRGKRSQSQATHGEAGFSKLLTPWWSKAMSPCRNTTLGFTEVEEEGAIRAWSSAIFPQASACLRVHNRQTCSLPQRTQVLSCVRMPELVTPSIEGHLSVSTSASQELGLPLQSPGGVGKPGCEARDLKRASQSYDPSPGHSCNGEVAQGLL